MFYFNGNLNKQKNLKQNFFYKNNFCILFFFDAEKQIIKIECSYFFLISLHFVCHFSPSPTANCSDLIIFLSLMVQRAHLYTYTHICVGMCVYIYTSFLNHDMSL